MINVNQITAQLARMPDQALQQFAAMHKNDPYTVSLALSESNRRKQMRTAGQGAQGMQPQPKVVDQGIAGMAAPAAPQPMPEDTGIAQLPAGDMNFADGGIVAFAGGGTPDEVNERYRQKQLQSIRDLFGVTGVTRGSQSGMTPEEKQSGIIVPQAPAVSGVYPDENLRGFKPDAGTLNALGADTGAGNKQLPPPPGAQRPAGIAQLAPAAPAPVFDVNAEYAKARAAATGVDPAAAEMLALQKQMREAPEQALKERQDEIAKEGDVYKGKEERLKGKEQALGKMDEQNKSMAFLQAGLSMMQSRGRGLSGIAAGAGVGVKQYGEGIEKLRAAQERLDETREKMEDLRLNRSDMNAREVRQLKGDIRKGEQDASKLGIDALRLTDNLSREEAKTKFGAAAEIATTGMKIQGQKDVAALSRAAQMEIAKMPSAQMQMIEKLGGGDFNKGYEIYKQEAAIPRLYDSYIKKAEDQLNSGFKAKYPTFETYLAGMGGGKGAGMIDIPADKAGAVRPR